MKRRISKTLYHWGLRLRVLFSLLSPSMLDLFCFYYQQSKRQNKRYRKGWTPKNFFGNDIEWSYRQKIRIFTESWPKTKVGTDTQPRTVDIWTRRTAVRSCFRDSGGITNFVCSSSKIQGEKCICFWGKTHFCFWCWWLSDKFFRRKIAVAPFQLSAIENLAYSW